MVLDQVPVKLDLPTCLLCLVVGGTRHNLHLSVVHVSFPEPLLAGI